MDMEGRDPAAGGGAGGSSAAEEDKYTWVPVRVARLTYLLEYLSAVKHTRWLGYLAERWWVERALAVAAAVIGPDDDDAEQQLKLARDLQEVMSVPSYSFSCMLHDMAEIVAEAVDPGGALRPRPESANWWRHWYNEDKLPGSHGFVHLTRGEAARAGRLVADARARTQRLTLAAGAGDAGGVFSTPALLALMRRAARLADAVLLPLQELRRLVDYLIEVNNSNLRGRGGRERRRRRSAPPSRRTPASEPVLRRSASMSSLRLSIDLPA